MINKLKCEVQNLLENQQYLKVEENENEYII